MPGPSSPCKANVNGRRQKMAVDNAMTLTNKKAIEEGQPGSSSAGIPQRTNPPGPRPCPSRKKASMAAEYRGRSRRARNVEMHAAAYYLMPIFCVQSWPCCVEYREKKKKEKSEGHAC